MFFSISTKVNFFLYISDTAIFEPEDTSTFEDLCASYLTRDENGLHQAEIRHTFFIRTKIFIEFISKSVLFLLNV